MPLLNHSKKTLNTKETDYMDNNLDEIVIELDNCIIEYFKDMSEDTGIPYKILINMCLDDCVNDEKKLKFV